MNWIYLVVYLEIEKRKRSTSTLYIVTLLFNLYTEYIMRNAGLDEAQAGIQIAGRNINNLRYADDNACSNCCPQCDGVLALVKVLSGTTSTLLKHGSNSN